MIINQTSLILISLLIIGLTLVRYFFYRRQRKILDKSDRKISEFIEAFDPSFFVDFSLFNFKRGAESLISPFPKQDGTEWKYTIYLSRADVEDLVTITHELTECTVGRLIERILSLKKPLYIERKESDKFWVHGKKGKYLLEHMVTTLSEIDQVENEKLRDRFSEEDFKEFIR
jgi:hypothetical protein